MPVAIKPKGNFWSNLNFDKIISDLQNITDLGSQVIGNYNQVRDQIGSNQGSNQGNNQGSNQGNYDISNYQTGGSVNPAQASIIPGLPNEAAYIGAGVLSLIALKKFKVI
jgi:hypothetical protein